MTAIVGIPTTRVSDAFVRERLLAQAQFSQLDLFKLQNALSTGRRLSLPSDDAPAALRSITLQSLIERKEQSLVNLKTNQSYLNATDTAMGGLSALLANVRGTALSVADSVSTDAQRKVAATEVTRAIEQLVDIGNHQFRDRYLFAGSATNVRPFDLVKGLVRYNGNNDNLQSYADLDLLFDTNLAGDTAFGAVSAAVHGTADLNRVLTPATSLADLYGGRGLNKGSVAVSDGANTSIVDISRAATIGDVARLLESQPPAGRIVTARVTNVGLEVSLDSAGGGNLTIGEVGGGTTARDLGILDVLGGSTGPIIGGDLNPRLTLTTPLGDILGVRASARLSPSGTDNDLILEAAVAGPQFNGARIQLVDDWKLQAAPGLIAGHEVASFHAQPVAARASLVLAGGANDLILTATQAGAAFNNVSIDVVNDGNIGNAANVSFNAGTRTLRIGIDGAGLTSTDAVIAAIGVEGTFTAARDSSAEINAAGGTISPTSALPGAANTRNSGGDANTLFVRIQRGTTTANDVVKAVNAEGTFTARLNPSEPGNRGTGIVEDAFTDPAATALTAGGSGIVFDKTSGVRVTNGGKTFVVDLSTAKTIEEVLTAFNSTDNGLEARINEAGNGIDVRSRISGSDFAIGENGGTTATELGIRSFTGATRLAELNYGRGVHAGNTPDLAIHRRDGVEFEISLASAVTIDDVLSLINNNATNLASGTPVVARLAAVGNGIELVNDGPSGPDALSVKALNLSQAAADLGLLASGAATSAPPTPGAKATGSLTVAGTNNDLVFTAKETGTQVNDVRVLLVDTGQGSGNESVSYNAAAKTLTFDINAATTTAADLVNVLANNPLTSFYFSAALAPSDGSPNDGSGLVGLAGTTTLVGGKAETLTGTDSNPLEVEGAFTALIRLRDALGKGDVEAIGRSIEILDASAAKVNFARADMGVRLQSLEFLQARVTAEQVDLKETLSGELDTDFVAAISSLAAKQASYEAALRVTAQITKLSLLDFF